MTRNQCIHGVNKTEINPVNVIGKHGIVNTVSAGSVGLVIINDKQWDGQYCM